METYGVVVIGAGPGGYPAAIRAAQLGAAVALVEREELGGTCLNWGCIPTKTLIASAELYSHLKSAGSLGIEVESSAVNYGALVDRKDQVVLKLRGGIKQLLNANGVKVLKGIASFEGRNRLAIHSEEGSESILIGAEKTIIATGCSSSMPGFLPRQKRIVESRSFLDLKTLPGSILVLGGGIIGCEFACLLANLGVRVTIVELLEDILWSLDPDVRQQVRLHMEKDLGIQILTGKPLENIDADDKSVRGTCGGQIVEADLLLAALGRRPATEKLNLANAGLQCNQLGYLEVDEYGRTCVPTIYAIGDITGGPQLAHAATSQGLVAAENACGRKLRKNETCVPACIFTSPEVGTVGISEQEARQHGRQVKTGKFLFRALGKGLATGQTSGFVKWIADSRTNQLLGAQAVGPHATELIAEATLAVRSELTVPELMHTIHAHPTLAEAWLESAHVLLGEPIHVPPPKKK